MQEVNSLRTDSRELRAEYCIVGIPHNTAMRFILTLYARTRYVQHRVFRLWLNFKKILIPAPHFQSTPPGHFDSNYPWSVWFVMTYDSKALFIYHTGSNWKKTIRMLQWMMKIRYILSLYYGFLSRGFKFWMRGTDVPRLVHVQSAMLSTLETSRKIYENLTVHSDRGWNLAISASWLNLAIISIRYCELAISLK